MPELGIFVEKRFLCQVIKKYGRTGQYLAHLFGQGHHAHHLLQQPRPWLHGRRGELLVLLPQRRAAVNMQIGRINALATLSLVENVVRNAAYEGMVTTIELVLILDDVRSSSTFYISCFAEFGEGPC